MSVTAWLIISIIGFSLAGIALIVAVFMFIKMNIPSVIGDLTGKTVAREIKAMREFNNSKGDRRFRPSKVNLERGTITEKVDNSINKDVMSEAHISKRLDNEQPISSPPTHNKQSGGTVGLNDYAPNETEVLSENSQATEVLSDNATEVLDSSATEILDNNATEVLSSSVEVETGETTVLSNTEKLDDVEKKPVAFKITKEKVAIHTDEVIQ